MLPVVAFGAAGAGADVGVVADTEFDVGASNGEDGETGCSGVATPEGEAPLCGGSLCRSLRFAGIPTFKSRAAVQSRTSRSMPSLRTKFSSSVLDDGDLSWGIG